MTDIDAAARVWTLLILAHGGLRTIEKSEGWSPKCRAKAWDQARWYALGLLAAYIEITGQSAEDVQAALEREVT